MRSILLIMMFCRFVPALGQNFVTKDGEFMDTTLNSSSRCDSGQFLYYYSVDGKYPESPASLLKEARAYLAEKNNIYSGSGYVTFRFVIDCEGHPLRKVQVIQTDGQYKDFHFKKAFVSELYDYLKTLDKWKTARDKSGQTYAYTAFISFKIKDGKVVNIIP